ncbi:helix-turn-helix transcriptional regulator [Mesobacterium pallidum]|uniref:helix-turn-helix transcriptional regulator n=1 Tax=Mesobacterium pallidum TaxID=2872037 RepID=UPI001EE2271B
MTQVDDPHTRPPGHDGGGPPIALGGAAGIAPGDVVHEILAIAHLGTIEEVWQRTAAALRRYGFVRVNYGFTRFRTGLGIGDPDDAFFLSTHALEKVKAFHETGLYLRSADYRWVRENVGACPWDWVTRERAAGRLSPEEERTMDQLGAGRGRAGMTISFAVTLPRSKGAMGLAAPKGTSQDEVNALWRAQGEAIEALCNFAHLKLSQLPMPVPSGQLSDRQREILEWIADGKSLQDVCVLTGLSLSSVEKHLRRARDLLGVETTPHAVAKASFLNQLFARNSAG